MRRRPATVLPVLLLALALTVPATSQTATLSATTNEVSAATGGLIGYQIFFPTGGGKNYILLMSLGNSGFSFGQLHIPLDPDFLTVHTFFGDLGVPIFQSRFRGPLFSDNAVAFLGFPPGFLDVHIGMRLYLAAIQFPTGFLPDDATNAVELLIVF